MNIQRKNSAHHFRMQSEREQTLVTSICSSHTRSISGVDLLEMTLKGSIVAFHGHPPDFLEDSQKCVYS